MELINALKTRIDKLYDKYASYQDTIDKIYKERSDTYDELEEVRKDYAKEYSNVIRKEVNNALFKLVGNKLIYIDTYIVGKSKIGFIPVTDENRKDPYRIANNKTPHVEIYKFDLTGYDVNMDSDSNDPDIFIELKVKNLYKYEQLFNCSTGEFIQSVHKSDIDHISVEYSKLEYIYKFDDCPSHLTRRINLIKSVCTESFDYPYYYRRFTWPAYQEFQNKPGFDKNAYYDAEHDIYFISELWLKKVN